VAWICPFAPLCGVPLVFVQVRPLISPETLSGEIAEGRMWPLRVVAIEPVGDHAEGLVAVLESVGAIRTLASSDQTGREDDPGVLGRRDERRGHGT